MIAYLELLCRTCQRPADDVVFKDGKLQLVYSAESPARPATATEMNGEGQ